MMLPGNTEIEDWDRIRRHVYPQGVHDYRYETYVYGFSVIPAHAPELGLVEYGIVTAAWETATGRCWIDYQPEQ